MKDHLLLCYSRNFKQSFTDIWFTSSRTWWVLQNVPRECVSIPHYPRAKIQLENFCGYLAWTCFEENMEKALFSSLFFFYIWQTYFLSFLFFRLNNFYLFKIISQAIFPSFLITLLFSSGISPIGQNPSPVVVLQTRKKSFPVSRGTKEPLYILYK